jgi:Cu(I)/Ag(I) efflux system periplasmic protein CusF
MSRSNSTLRRSRAYLLVCALVTGAVVTPAAVHAQGMKDMKDMPMGQAKQTTATASGTITAVNATAKKVTIDHGPIPEIKWPPMKMEFAAAPSVDLGKVKTGDKVRFTLSGSGSTYTVQSISPGP